MSSIVPKTSRKRKRRAAAELPDSTQAKRLLAFLRAIHDDEEEPVYLMMQRGDKAFTYVCDDPRHVLKDWGRLSQFDQVFFGLHPSSQTDSLDRRRIAHRGKGRTADTIWRIRAVQIDIDPIRSEKAKGNATEDERRHASKLAMSVYKYLKRKGWPKPFVLSSGNGYQIFYLCDFLTEFQPKIQQLQKHLDKKFSSEVAQVDPLAARLTQFGRLPGMENRKGAETKKRPVRKAILCKGFRSPGGKLTESDFDFLPDLRKPPQSKIASPRTVLPLKFRPDLMRRALNYTKQMPEARSGDWGHDKTYRVAGTLAEKFDLTEAEAVYILQRYNQRCIPPWNESELHRKWEEAKENVSRVMFQERELEDFFGFVPDWGIGLYKEILKHINQPNWSAAHIVSLFAVTQFRRIQNVIPANFLRQFLLQPPFSRNWRRDLDAKVHRHWRELESFRSPSTFENCVFCSIGAKSHTHYCMERQQNFFRHEFWAFEERESVILASDYANKNHISNSQILELVLSKPGAFYAFTHPKLTEAYKALWNSQTLRLTYWPTLLLGQVAGMPRDEIRAIFGLTSELTRESNGPDRSKTPTTITGGMVGVGVPSNKTQCPFLDKDQEYVVFGGNGRRAGLGYQPVGRTNKGWLSKLMVPHERAPGRETKASQLRRLRFLLSNLVPRLQENFGIVAVAHHPGSNEWRGPDALAKLAMTESGFDWLQKTTIRFYAPEDWTTRWRNLLCARLGYQSIPKNSSEVFTGQRKRDPKRVDNLVQFLKERKLTQAKFAAALSKHFGMTFSEKRVQIHLSGKRDKQDFWDFVWLYLDFISTSESDISLTDSDTTGRSKSQDDLSQDRASHKPKPKTSQNSNEAE